MRVFLDANILFSASFSKSQIRQMLDGLATVAELVTSSHAVEEARRNLSVKKPANLPELESFLIVVRIFAVDAFEIEVDLAQKDIPILCGAIASKSDYLLTGDKKDFGPLFGKIIGDVKIVSVELLLADLIARGIASES